MITYLDLTNLARPMGVGGNAEASLRICVQTIRFGAPKAKKANRVFNLSHVLAAHWLRSYE